MTDTATREALEIFLKDSPGCETVHQPCTEPVAWRHVRTCCGHTALLCNKHKRKHERYVATEGRQDLRCAHCKNLAMNAYIPV